MKTSRRIPALALAAAIPVTAMSAGIAAAQTDGNDITLNFGSAAADSNVSLKVNGSEVDSKKADSNGTVKFNHTAEGAETLVVVVDGESITLTDAQCTSNGGGSATGTPVTSDTETPSTDTDAPGTSSTEDPSTPGGSGGLSGIIDTIMKLLGGSGGGMSGIIDIIKGLIPGLGGGAGAKVEGQAAQSIERLNKDQTIKGDGLDIAASKKEAQSIAANAGKAREEALAKGDTKTAEAYAKIQKDFSKVAKGENVDQASGISALSGILSTTADTLIASQAAGESQAGLLDSVKGIISPIIGIISPIVDAFGGIDAVLGMVSAAVPQIAPFTGIISSVYKSIVANAGSDTTLPGGTDTTTTPTTDAETPTDVNGDGTASGSEIKTSVNGNEVTIELGEGAGSVNCDITAEAGDEDEDTDASDSSTPSSPAPSVAQKASNPGVSTPGPKVNTGGEVEGSSFFQKVASVLS